LTFAYALSWYEAVHVVDRYFVHYSIANFNEKEQYEVELSRYVSTKNKEDMQKPQETPLHTLFIPANNSVTGLFPLLKENEEKG
jgi:hypothetical protein